MWLIPALQHRHYQSAPGSPIQPSPGLPGQQTFHGDRGELWGSAPKPSRHAFEGLKENL